MRRRARARARRRAPGAAAGSSVCEVNSIALPSPRTRWITLPVAQLVTTHDPSSRKTYRTVGYVTFSPSAYTTSVASEDRTVERLGEQPAGDDRVATLRGADPSAVGSPALRRAGWRGIGRRPPSARASPSRAGEVESSARASESRGPSARALLRTRVINSISVWRHGGRWSELEIPGKERSGWKSLCRAVFDTVKTRPFILSFHGIRPNTRHHPSSRVGGSSAPRDLLGTAGAYHVSAGAAVIQKTCRSSTPRSRSRTAAASRST